jgi:hypothetical protein
VLPLGTPLLLHALNAYGVARVLALYDTLLEGGYYKDARGLGLGGDMDGTEDDDSEHEGPPYPAKGKGPPDVETHFAVPWRRVARYSRDVWAARAFTTLPRSASLLWDLAAITVLCAVDKEGVLSHPLPSVEKVFIINDPRDGSVYRRRHSSSGSDLSMESVDSAGHGHGHALDEEEYAMSPAVPPTPTPTPLARQLVRLGAFRLLIHGWAHMAGRSATSARRRTTARRGGSGSGRRLSRWTCGSTGRASTGCGSSTSAGASYCRRSSRWGSMSCSTRHARTRGSPCASPTTCAT